MDSVAKLLDQKLHKWQPQTSEEVRRWVAEIINLADHDTLGLLRSRSVEQSILDLLDDSAANRKVIFPIHPRTKKIYDKISKSFDKIRIVEPVGYFELLALLKNSALVMTDSGGMQKEAFWLGVPCITLRNETEWIETIEGGWNVLYKDYKGEHSCSDNNRAYYGDGKASERILNYFLNTGE